MSTLYGKTSFHSSYFYLPLFWHVLFYFHFIIILLTFRLSKDSNVTYARGTRNNVPREIFDNSWSRFSSSADQWYTRIVGWLPYHYIIVVYRSIISKLMCFSDQKANTIMYYWMSFLLDFGITNQFHYTRTFCHVFIQLSIYLKRLCYFINIPSEKI